MSGFISALISAPFGFTDDLIVEQVKEKMIEYGSGESRVVVIQQGGIQHVINVVNKDGEIYFIDSQIGKVVELDPNLTLDLGGK
jgi:filamentous hemagglutinin